MDGIFGTDIASPSVQHILLETRKAVIQSYIFRHSNPTNSRLSINLTPVGKEEDLVTQSASTDGDSQENSEVRDMAVPALSAPRKSGRPRKRKRYFDEVE